ncbi:uncharacterized protein [Lolium perenne]|uniref:uncharacterized protein isoform X2 n=1 Tax=Lolium perenne TaxID=4522 RepID=UPI003A9918C5
MREAEAEAASARRRTLVLVNLTSMLEKADEVLLPAVYREVGQALGVSVTALGSLTLCRALVQALSFPLAAYASARHDRARVVAVGAFLWAAATFLVAISRTYLQMAISRGLNGIGLALVIPAINSLVADYTDDHTRGAAFGWLQMTCNLGSILGGSFGVLLAPTTFLGVVDGWRLAFHIVAAISVALGFLMWFLAADPVAKSKNAATAKEEARELLHVARAVMAVPTFQVIVAQGIAGLIAWSGLNFATMWLELAGFTHWETSIITGLYLFATALGALFGGSIGDIVSRSFPDTGRIALAQISSASALPLGAILLLALPNDPSTGVAHAVVFFIMGFAISWNAASTNKLQMSFWFAAPSSPRSCRRRRERRSTRWTSASSPCWLPLRLSSSVFWRRTCSATSRFPLNPAWRRTRRTRPRWPRPCTRSSRCPWPSAP